MISEFTSAWITTIDPIDSTDTIAASTSYFSPAGTASRWLITPQLSLGAFGNYINWNARSHDPSFPDDYLVLVSTTDSQITSFTDTIGNINEEDLDGDGIPDSITIYQSQSECLNQCDPCYNGSVYVCTTDSAVIDDDDSTNPSQFSSNDECLASGCNPCLAENLDGWNIQDDEITFSLSGELLLDTLVVNLEINDTPQTDPILVDFPSFDQIEVREALIDDGTQFDDYGIDGIESTGDFGEQDQIYQNQETLYSNQFILNVDNGFFGSAELNLDFSNIYDEDILYSEKPWLALKGIPRYTVLKRVLDLMYDNQVYKFCISEDYEREKS